MTKCPQKKLKLNNCFLNLLSPIFCRFLFLTFFSNSQFFYTLDDLFQAKKIFTTQKGRFENLSTLKPKKDRNTKKLRKMPFLKFLYIFCHSKTTWSKVIFKNFVKITGPYSVCIENVHFQTEGPKAPHWIFIYVVSTNSFQRFFYKAKLPIRKYVSYNENDNYGSKPYMQGIWKAPSIFYKVSGHQQSSPLLASTPIINQMTNMHMALKVRSKAHMYVHLICFSLFGQGTSNNICIITEFRNFF